MLPARWREEGNAAPEASIAGNDRLGAMKLIAGRATLRGRGFVTIASERQVMARRSYLLQVVVDRRAPSFRGGLGVGHHALAADFYRLVGRTCRRAHPDERDGGQQNGESHDTSLQKNSPQDRPGDDLAKLNLS
jgi:hypothetical protein